MSTDETYASDLEEFVDKSIRRWAKQKKEHLEPKLTRNFNAVTNREFRNKTWKEGEAKGWRSDTWIGFIRVKIWAFYSILLDTVLKAGKIPFDLEPLPYEENMDRAWMQDRDRRVERMRDKIESQLAARKADREFMKKCLSLGYYGMAFSKFNVEPVLSTEFKQVGIDTGEAAQFLSPEEAAQYTRYELVRNSEDTPGHRYVSVWNMVWDMEGNSIEDGQGCAEYIPSSPYDLRKLTKLPGYIEDAIIRLIEEKRHDNATDTSESPAENPVKSDMDDRKQKFSRYEYCMRAPRKFVEEFEAGMRSKKIDLVRIGSIDQYDETEESGDEIEIMGEICEKKIVRHIRNDTGRRLHKMGVVEQNLDETTGTGISDNTEGVQAVLTGMIRAFEDNKKLSANVTSAIKKRFFNLPEQVNDIFPGKQYDISDDCDDVRKAIMPIVFPDVGDSLLSGIELAKRFLDDVSMIPTIMQGFTLPKHQPDTAYEMRQLTENAGKYVGQTIRNNDEMFIEPEIWDIYEYNMLYDPDDSIKVNCKVKANGFTSFQNKEIRGERMKMALSTFVTNEVLMPYVKIKPHLDVIYESMDEDPEKFINSEEEIAAKAQQEMEAQAQAEQRAIETQAAIAEHDAALKAAESDQKHQQDVEKSKVEYVQKLNENEQTHENAMEEAILQARLDAIYGQPQPQGVQDAAY